jgi:hypothetical protein
MRQTTVITLGIVRIAGIAQIVLGTLFWTGRAYQYLPVHVAIGALLVLGLWTIAIVSLTAKVNRGPAVFALVWGIALPVFGMRQGMILVGALHWIIQVVHLLMGITAMALADRLAKRVLAASPNAVSGWSVDRAGFRDV